MMIPLSKSLFDGSLKHIANVMVLCIYLLLTPAPSCAQTIIYRNNGTQISVNNIDITPKIVTYTLVGDSAKNKHYLGTSTIDSIRFENGALQNFSIANDSTKSTKLNQIPKHYKHGVGMDVMTTMLNSRLDLIYKYNSPNERFGLKCEMVLPTNDQIGVVELISSYAKFTIDMGGCVYFMRTPYSRLHLGGSYLIGQFMKEDWTYYNEENTKPEWHASPMWNIGVDFFMVKQFCIYGDLEFIMGSTLKGYTTVWPHIGMVIFL